MRENKTPLMKWVSKCELPTRYGMFTLHGFYDESNHNEHIALVMGDSSHYGPLLVRIHSECLTGEALGSLRCDCGFQLEAAMQAIKKEGAGIIIYLRQEGRGIGLLNKIRAYNLQDRGADTVEANEMLGFAPDVRDYRIAVGILSVLKINNPIRLMTNNNEKIIALKESGFNVCERVPVIVGACCYNKNYLDTKAKKFGHLLDES